MGETGTSKLVNRLVLALLGAAALLRLGWAYASASGTGGEARNVALAIASGRGIADAYAVGQGPTAHLSPISPGIAGITYRLLGIESVPAEVLLTLYTVALALLSYWLLFRTFGRLGSPLPARLAALAFLCVAPTYIGQESKDFKIWDGGLSAALLALFLDRLTAANAKSRIGTGDLALLAIILAVLFFVSPNLGLGGYLAALILAWRRLDWGRFFGAGALAAVALAAVLTPWVIRNDRVMGEPIVLRSNAGLELALANHPDALSGRDERQVFLDRIRAIHPLQGEAAYARMVAAGGEVAYARALGDEAKAWMMAHPADAARLAVRHVRQIFWPDPWQFAAFRSGAAVGLRTLLAGLIGTIGLAGMLWRLWRRDWDWLPVAAVVLVAALSYAPFQPINRYTYLFYAPLAYCAFDLLLAAARAAWERRGRRQTGAEAA